MKPTSVIFLPSFSSANTTTAMPLGATLSVLFRKLMTALTVSLSFIYGRYATASRDIFFQRNQFNMFRVYAARIAAQVVGSKSLRDLSARRLKSHSMRHFSFIIEPITPVTVMRFTRDPNPTGFSLFHLSPKSIAHMRGVI